MKITYLVGAGASCNCLPLGDELVKDFGDFKGLLKSSLEPNTDLKKDYRKDVSQLARDCEYIFNEANKHGSFDTYAKKLWLTNTDKDLNMLKSCLSTYFLYKQKFTKGDPRYDKFWASILAKDLLIKFPNEINIITWNYDFQFKSSLTPYFEEHISQLGYPYFFPTSLVTENSFFVYPLNGIAGPYKDGSKMIWPDSDWHSHAAAYQHPYAGNLSNYYKESFNKEKLIKFAWEGTDEELQYILPILIHTKVLVIIGYSFPFFNRDTDIKLFKALSGIEKIYYQVLNPSKSFLHNRFKKVCPLLNNQEYEKFIEIIEPGQFYLPEEL